MSATTARYAAAIRHRTDAMFLAFVGALPPAGWEGTAAALADRLRRVADDARIVTCTPGPSGVRRAIETSADVIRRAGWAVGFSRTRAGRLIRFTRLPTPTV